MSGQIVVGEAQRGSIRVTTQSRYFLLAQGARWMGQANAIA
jgi:hypothetical protein